MLSETVANGLKLYVLQDNTKETEKFVRMFDKFFDCLNGRNLKEHILRRKPNLKPYFSSSDGRLEVQFARYRSLRIAITLNFAVAIERLPRLFGCLGS